MTEIKKGDVVYCPVRGVGQVELTYQALLRVPNIFSKEAHCIKAKVIFKGQKHPGYYKLEDLVKLHKELQMDEDILYLILDSQLKVWETIEAQALRQLIILDADKDKYSNYKDARDKLREEAKLACSQQEVLKRAIRLYIKQ